MKLTHWFDGDEKPFRTGIYELDKADPANTGKFKYAEYDGRRWLIGGDSIQECLDRLGKSSTQNKRWRGRRIP